MLTFAAAVVLLIATPGPGVLSLAGVGSAFGASPTRDQRGDGGGVLMAVYLPMFDLIGQID